MQAIDVSTGTLFEQNYPRICRELGGVPRDDSITAARNTLPPVHPLPARHWMPHLSLGDKFVGRVGALWDLHDSLFRDATTVVQGTGVVAGTGGLGKTQLAIEYAHRFSQDLTLPELIAEMTRVREVAVLNEFAAEYRDELPSRHERDVVSTFQLSWNIAPHLAKQLLRVMGELAPAPVPRKSLRTVLNLPEQPPLQDELRKAIAELARLSLVEVSSSGEERS